MCRIVWVVSVLSAAAYVVIGLGKLTPSTGELEAASQGVPVLLLRIAGVAEVTGALGLILPAATRIAPGLTAVAGCGLVATMAGAIVTNVVIGAYAVTLIPIILGALTVLVVWARRGR